MTLSQGLPSRQQRPRWHRALAWGAPAATRLEPRPYAATGLCPLMRVQGRATCPVRPCTSIVMCQTAGRAAASWTTPTFPARGRVSATSPGGGKGWQQGGPGTASRSVSRATIGGEQREERTGVEWLHVASLPADGITGLSIPGTATNGVGRSIVSANLRACRCGGWERGRDSAGSALESFLIPSTMLLRKIGPISVWFL